MFKKSIRLALIYFAVTTVSQLVINKEVNWIDNITIYFMMILIRWFYNWSRVPYEWNKDKTEKVSKTSSPS